jgi:septal ring-binding cell division protein DamX
MRVAAIEGAKARADVDANDIAVRKNMERLRALRLAKEATEATQPKPVKTAKPKKKAAAKPAGSLSDFLASQKSSGRTT